MGELDQKPFQDACLEKRFGEDPSVKAAELCSSWEKNIKDPHWQPFKRIKLDGKSSVCALQFCSFFVPLACELLFCSSSCVLMCYL